MNHGKKQDSRGSRVALVTGGSRNIGRAIAKTLAEKGYFVYVAGQTKSASLQETYQNIISSGGKGGMVFADLSDPTAIRSMVDQIGEEVGGIHILVNNAAIRPATPILDITPVEWDNVLAVNLRGAFLCSQLVIPHMVSAGFGRIINITGVDAYWGTPNRCHVVASKAGLIGLTRALASEISDFGITANCLVLGFIDTVREGVARSLIHDEWRKVRINQTLLKRAGKPEDVAHMVAFIASDESQFITGQEIHINGGGYPTVRGAESEYDEIRRNLISKGIDA